MSWRNAFIEHLSPGGFAGTTFRDWMRVLRDTRFALDIAFWPRAAFITCNSALNSSVRCWENLRYGSAIARTSVEPPLFILGVWRSGTTHLHNLLARDSRFAFPNTYEVLYPHTFLTTEPTGSRVMQWIMPSTRPMDRVKNGVNEPQEDEFALVASGLSFMIGLTVFQSTMHTWHKVKSFWGLQHGEVDETRVLQDYVQVYDAFFAQRHQFTDENFCEVRFDDLE